MASEAGDIFGALADDQTQLGFTFENLRGRNIRQHHGVAIANDSVLLAL